MISPETYTPEGSYDPTLIAITALPNVCCRTRNSISRSEVPPMNEEAALKLQRFFLQPENVSGPNGIWRELVKRMLLYLYAVNKSSVSIYLNDKLVTKYGST